MTISGSITENLPAYTPDSVIRFEESHEIVTDTESGTLKTTYRLDKAPFERLDSVTAIVNGVQQDLTIGGEVTAVDTEGDGELHALRFETVDPDIGTEFTVMYDAVPIIIRYVASYDSDIETVADIADVIKENRSVEKSGGSVLDLLGAFFGDIGERRGRDDDEYRSYLLSVVKAFSATGTKRDLEFVAAASLGITPEDVTVTEDTTEVGFKVTVDNLAQALFAQSVNELLREASAAGVELLSPPVLESERATVSVTAEESTVTAREDGLGSGTLE